MEYMIRSERYTSFMVLHYWTGIEKISQCRLTLQGPPCPHVRRKNNIFPNVPQEWLWAVHYMAKYLRSRWRLWINIFIGQSFYWVKDEMLRNVLFGYSFRNSVNTLSKTPYKNRYWVLTMRSYTEIESY